QSGAREHKRGVRRLSRKERIASNRLLHMELCFQRYESCLESCAGKLMCSKHPLMAAYMQLISALMHGEHNAHACSDEEGIVPLWVHSLPLTSCSS
uniref:Uncharacterized protein n=1 Tax=Salvator merianae TaxID=96440 RepID=A0A8D0DHY5_SALMN